MSKQNLKSAIREHQKRTGANYTQARREVLSPEHDTSPAPFMAQAASTTDPEVLQALEDIYLLERHFFHERKAFVERVTGAPEFFSRRESFGWSPISRLSSVGGAEKPSGEFGRWKQGPHGRGWVPAKNSKMEAEFDALNEVPSVVIPGAERVRCIFLGHYMLNPVFLLMDGKVWLRFSENAEGNQNLSEDDRIGTNWVRERNSDAMRAIEDWNERNGKRPLLPLDSEEQTRVEHLFEQERQRKAAHAEEVRKFWEDSRAKPEKGEAGSAE